MRHDQEANFSRHISILLVLSSSGTAGQSKENIPRKADLEEHFKIQNSKHTRIKLSTHEEVVERISSHAVLSSPSQCREVGNDGNEESGADCYRHDRSELIDDGVELEEASVVQEGGNHDGGVE